MKHALLSVMMAAAFLAPPVCAQDRAPVPLKPVQEKPPEFDPDILLVRRMENCSALMLVISDNMRAKGNADVAARAAESADQYKLAAKYYAGAVSAGRVEGNVANAKEKIAYLHRNGGDDALADDIAGCGSDELAKKGQAALDAQKEADEKGK